MYLCTCKVCGCWFTSDRPMDKCQGASMCSKPECKDQGVDVLADEMSGVEDIYQATSS